MGQAKRRSAMRLTVFGRGVNSLVAGLIATLVAYDPFWIESAVDRFGFTIMRHSVDRSGREIQQAYWRQSAHAKGLDEEITIDHWIEAWEIPLAESVFRDAIGTATTPAERKLLSRLRYFGGDSATAQKICQPLVSASEADVRSWCEYMARLGETPQQFRERQLGDFIFRWVDPRDELLVEWGADHLSEARRRMGALLGGTPDAPIWVEIYPDLASFINASTLTRQEVESSGTIALCKFNKLMLVSPRVVFSGFPWVDTLNHEYIHYLLKRTYGARVPVWLHEGIAKVFEQVWRTGKPSDLTSATAARLSSANQQQQLIGWEKMHPSIAKLGSPEAATLAFAEVQSFVLYLVRQFGQDRLVAALTHLRETPSDNAFAAFAKATGRSWTTLEQAWREAIPARVKSQGNARVLKFREQSQGESLDAPPDLPADSSARLRDLVRLGDHLMQVAFQQEAVVEYQKAEQIDPDLFAVQQRLAHAYEELRRLDDAKKAYLAALTDEPDSSSTRVLYARFLARQKKWRDAVDQCWAALWLNPFVPELYEILIDASRALDDGKTVERATRSIERLATPHPEAR